MNSIIPLLDVTHEPDSGKKAAVASFDSSAADFPSKLLAQFETIRTKIFAEFRTGFERYSLLIERAIHQAAALAWQTDFPNLFFPELAAENVRKVVTRLRRQQPAPEPRSPFAESSSIAPHALITLGMLPQPRKPGKRSISYCRR